MRRLKMSTKTAMIPVIVLSGTTKADDPQKALDMGAAAFLPKPPEPESLFSALASVLDGANEPK